MIDAMFQAGTDASLDDMVLRPKPVVPEAPGFKLGAFLKDGIARPIAGSVANRLAFGAEITGAFGESVAATNTIGAAGMFGGLSDEERKQGEKARRKMLDSDIFSNEAGDIARQRAKELMPDPNTAHTSTQMMAGFVDFAGAAVGYGLTTGPAAPFLLAGDRGMAEADRLKQQGVDQLTRTKVGAVSGALDGLAVALPVALPGKVLPTVGLIAAGGPGGFMAQQAGSKAILEHAGYDKQAATYDPLDPVGLALSTLVPAGFGAVAMRAGRARPATAPTLESVVLGLESGGKDFGKDGKILTSPKGAQGRMQVMPATQTDPGFGVKPAANNSPEEIARVGRDYLGMLVNRYGGDEAKAMAAYNAGPGALDAALKKGGDWLGHMPAETQAYVKNGMKKLGSERTAETVRTAVANEPDIVAAARVRQVLDQLDSSRLTPATDIKGQDAHVDAIDTARMQLMSGEPVAVSEPMRMQEFAPLPEGHPFTAWADQTQTAAAEVRAEIARAEAARPLPKSEPSQPLDSKDEAQGTANVAATGKVSPFQAAFDELAPQLEGKQPGQLVNELKTGGKLSPLANNAIIGLVETGGDPKKITSLVQHADALAKEAPGRPAADVMADAIERMRNGEPAPAQAKPDPQVEAMRQRAEQAEAANPDMPVRMSEDGERVTALQELEAIRKEAAEGTDTALGSNDAPLLQVAANCFLGA